MEVKGEGRGREGREREREGAGSEVESSWLFGQNTWSNGLTQTMWHDALHACMTLSGASASSSCTRSRALTSNTFNQGACVPTCDAACSLYGAKRINRNLQPSAS